MHCNKLIVLMVASLNYLLYHNVVVSINDDVMMTIEMMMGILWSML